MTIYPNRPIKALLLASLIGITSLSTTSPHAQPQPQMVVPAPPQIAAKSWIMMDADTGDIITSHNEDVQRSPASLAKLMTAFVVEHDIQQGRLTLNDPVRISKKAWQTGGSKMFIEVDKYVSIGELLQGIIIVSGNDATIAVAEHIAGSEEGFSDLMNQHAQRMGMKNTTFRNASGLPDSEQRTTAKDLAILSRHIINDYPEHYALYSQREFTYGGITQPNRNKLLWRDKSVDGLKTGWTNAAGYNLVASAKRDGMRLITVVMGTSSPEARARETQKLLSYGFRFFETQHLGRDLAIEPVRIWGGKSNQVAAGISEAVPVTLPRTGNTVPDVTIDLPQGGIFAPIEEGEQVGKVEYSLDGEVIAEQPILAMESVEKGNGFKRFWDLLVRFFTEIL